MHHQTDESLQLSSLPAVHELSALNYCNHNDNNNNNLYSAEV